MAQISGKFEIIVCYLPLFDVSSCASRYAHASDFVMFIWLCHILAPGDTQVKASLGERMDANILFAIEFKYDEERINETEIQGNRIP